MDTLPNYIQRSEPREDLARVMKKAYEEKLQEPPDEPLVGPTKRDRNGEPPMEVDNVKEKDVGSSVEKLIAASPDCDDWIEVMGDFAFSNEQNLPQEKKNAFREFMLKGPGMMRIDFLRGINAYIQDMFPGQNPYDTMLLQHQASLDEQEAKAGEELANPDLTPEKQNEVNEKFLRIQQSRELILQMRRALKHMRDAVKANNEASAS